MKNARLSRAPGKCAGPEFEDPTHSGCRRSRQPQQTSRLPASKSIRYKLHKLSGELNGFWSVAVSGNWRVVFRFEHGEAELVDYLDYH
jgi:hypothetical protein